MILAQRETISTVKGELVIPKIRKILYTTDLSENSVYVFRYALNSAEMHNAKIDILHVLKPTMMLPDMVADMPVDFGTNADQALAIIKKRLDDLLQKETKYNPDRANLVSSIEVIEGDPVDMILQKAREERPDVIIMGTHSKGFIAETFLGSVATNVLKRSRLPVFIIPIPED